MYSAIAANKRKTFYLFVFFMILVAGLSWLVSAYVGDRALTPYVFIGGLIYAGITYYSGSKMALAINKAQEIQKKDNPRLFRIVENLAITEGLPMPKVYIMDDPAPNAFATGRDPKHAAVCATTGLLDIMDDSELEGVMAHELGHIKNYDIRVSMYAFALVALISILIDVIWWSSWSSDSREGNSYLAILGIVAIVLAPLIAAAIQLSISRRREFLADATGALATRYPEGLARALEKIGKHGSAIQKPNTSTAHLFFANPLSKKSMSSLFSTHPPIEDRVNKLREIAIKE